MAAGDFDLIFTVDVDYTDRTIANGRFNQGTVQASVAADTDVNAQILAAQFATALLQPDDMVIATRIVDVVV